MKNIKWKTKPEISKRMSKIKTKGSQPEKKLAKALWHEGIRYRLNYKELPGSPDIVILKYQIAIFVDGEFWHGKDFELRKQDIKSNRSQWIEKIEENMERDRRNDKLLHQLGWSVIHFWEKEILKDTGHCVDEIKMFIDHQFENMYD